MVDFWKMETGNFVIAFQFISLFAMNKKIILPFVVFFTYLLIVLLHEYFTFMWWVFDRVVTDITARVL